MTDQELAATLAAIHTSILTVNDRVTNVFTAVQALRLLLVPLGISQTQFDEVLHKVQTDYGQRMKALEAQALEAAELVRQRRLLENFEGKPQ